MSLCFADDSFRDDITCTHLLSISRGFHDVASQVLPCYSSAHSDTTHVTLWRSHGWLTTARQNFASENWLLHWMPVCRIINVLLLCTWISRNALVFLLIIFSRWTLFKYFHFFVSCTGILPVLHNVHLVKFTRMVFHLLSCLSLLYCTCILLHCFSKTIFVIEKIKAFLKFISTTWHF